MSQLKNQTGHELTHYPNPNFLDESPCPENVRQILDLQDANQAYDEISSWPDYEVTRLHSLEGLARELSISKLWYKDESSRFGLGSFKALGGAYAVFRQLKKRIEAETSKTVNINDILNNKFDGIVSDQVVTTATDGNHGRSVAWGAQLFGCRSVIYIHADVSAGREKAIRQLGAEVVRVQGNYDEAVRQANTDAGVYRRILISDTSYAGYLAIPKTVALGYTTMLREITQQLESEIPTHVFLQGGVGSLASAVCAYFWQHWQEKRPRLIVVEPESANCLQQSARQGEPVAVTGDLHTLMAGLACGEVSLLAWEVLFVGCNDFMTVDEQSIVPCMKILAEGTFGDEKIIAGESAVPGLATLIGAVKSQSLKARLNLDEHSKILILGTEGATDPVLYRELMA